MIIEKELHLTTVEIEYFLVKQLKLKKRSVNTLGDSYLKLVADEQDKRYSHDAASTLTYQKIVRYLCMAIDKLAPQYPLLQSTAFALKSELQNGTHSSLLLLCYKAIKRLTSYK